jgi:hypothetical protein
MYTIENRSKNPRVFIDQHKRAVTVGVNMSREVDLDEDTAEFVKAQIERDEEVSGQEGSSGLSISGHAESAPANKEGKRTGRVRIQGAGDPHMLPGEGEPLDKEKKGGRNRRKAGSRAKSKSKDSDDGAGDDDNKDGE